MADVFLGSLTNALDAAELQELSLMSSDFRFLLGEYEVPDRVLLALCRAGYKSLSTFSVLADDRPGVRRAIATDLLIDPAFVGLAADLASKARSITASLMAAWVTAGHRQEETNRQAVENKSLRLPLTLSRTSLVSLRQKYEAEHGRVQDHIWPCAALLEKRLEEVEEGSFVAPPLSEVISVDKAEDDMLTIAEIGSSVRVRRAPKAIAAPSTTEELRDRFTTLAITYILASYKHSSRLWIKPATMAMWQRYVSFLLSDQVASYHLDQEGLSVRASWTTVLAYDLALRKFACRAVLYENKDFATALDEAMKDLGCRERYFITPTAMLTAASSSHRTTAPTGGKGILPTPELPGPNAPPNARKRKAAARLLKQQQEAKGRQKGKPKGKGKAEGKGSQLHTRTPDGRNLCKFYQTAEGCSKQGCTYVHACNKCLQVHSGSTCTAA